MNPILLSLLPVLLSNLVVAGGLIALVLWGWRSLPPPVLGLLVFSAVIDLTSLIMGMLGHLTAEPIASVLQDGGGAFYYIGKGVFLFAILALVLYFRRFPATTSARCRAEPPAGARDA